ncbi:MAG: mechanosensitive ion channel protein MscS [Planctomycetota bacterium]|nr:MAG: mechanosensitive ion channel protein MscS [Planctomycetota bacterium]
MSHMILRSLLLCGLLLGLPSQARVQAQAQPQNSSAPTAQAPGQLAQEAPSQLASPLGTLQFFLNKFDHKSGNWKADILSTLDAPAAMSREDRWQAAVYLLGILNRLAPDYRDKDYAPVEKDGRALFFPRAALFASARRAARGAGEIELVFDNGNWLFSATTLSSARSLYQALQNLPQIRAGAKEADLMSSLWLQGLMPMSLRKSILSLEYWQWIGLFLIVLLGIILDYSIRAVLRVITNRTLHRAHSYVSRDTVTAAVRPIGLCSAAFLWVALVPVIGLSGTSLIVLKGAVALFAVLAGTWAAWRVVDLVAEAASYRAEKTETKVDDILIPLLRKSVKIFILIFGIIYAAESMSIEIAPLIASLGIGGLAFAFAAKDTIENFFGSIAVLVDRPFAVGDWIVVGEVEGIVEDLGFRSTRVRTFYNSVVTLPNSTLVRATVDNYGKRKYRRTKCHIGVQYNTTPDQMLAFREGIMELVRTHPYTRKDYYQVWFHRFGPSSLDLLLYVFFETPDWSTELRERERLFLDIMRLAKQLGIDFAFPTRTVHLHQSGEEQSPPEPVQAPGSMSELRARVTGIRSVQSLIEKQRWRNEKPGPVTYTEGPTELDGLEADEIPGEERTET